MISKCKKAIINLEEIEFIYSRVNTSEKVISSTVNNNEKSLEKKRIGLQK